MDNDKKNLSCSDCAALNCYRRDKSFPEFCLTTRTSGEEIEEVNELYRKDEFAAGFSRAAAEIEGIYYGKLTRVEEIIAFAKRIGAGKIGLPPASV